MSNFIGVRIDKNLYELVRKDSRSTSDIVRTALHHYYETHMPEPHVDASRTVVKHKENTDEGDDIHHKVDLILKRFHK